MTKEDSTYCAYCGAEFPLDGSAFDVTQHIRSCEHHPMRVVERDNALLRERVRELEDELGIPGAILR